MYVCSGVVVGRISLVHELALAHTRTVNAIALKSNELDAARIKIRKHKWNIGKCL